jgi:hypothetical protein
MAVSPDKIFLAITNNGQSKQSIQLVDVKRELILDEVSIDKSCY